MQRQRFASSVAAVGFFAASAVVNSGPASAAGSSAACAAVNADQRAINKVVFAGLGVERAVIPGGGSDSDKDFLCNEFKLAQSKNADMAAIGESHPECHVNVSLRRTNVFILAERIKSVCS